MSRKPAAVGVIGLDLSLRCSAAVYLSPYWSPADPTGDLEWTTVGGEAQKGDFGAQTKRLHRIAGHLSDFVGERGVLNVYVEGAAYAQSAFQGVVLAELAGAVKLKLYEEFRIVAVPVHMMRARGYFLGGKCPKGAGVIVAKKVKEMGFPFETSDPGDALVIASWGRSELGMKGLICPLTG